VTVEEMAVVFSECGLLKEDENGVKIKIYRLLQRPNSRGQVEVMIGTNKLGNLKATDW